MKISDDPKMKNKPEIEKFCKYCERASSLSDPDSMLCSKKGIVGAGGKCRSFRYDPLKREPKIKKAPMTLEYVVDI